jgi:hypothetical protein
MEDYFAQSHDALVVDTRPEYFYQVGTTLENVEKVHDVNLPVLLETDTRRAAQVPQ